MLLWCDVDGLISTAFVLNTVAIVCIMCIITKLSSYMHQQNVYSSVDVCVRLCCQ